jgi:hypothetical protein
MRYAAPAAEHPSEAAVADVRSALADGALVIVDPVRVRLLRPTPH